MQQGLFAKYAIICHSKTLLLGFYEKHCRRNGETKKCKNSVLFILKEKTKLKKKTTEGINKMETQTAFLSHREREERTSKNKHGYVHPVFRCGCEDYGSFLLKCFTDGKFPEGQWERSERPSSLLHTIFRLILNSILANFVKFKLQL